MRVAFWVLLGLGASGLAFWLIASNIVPQNPLVKMFIIALFTLPSVGSFWMLYMVVRHERSPLGYIILAFIPFTFMWYYFDRVKPGKYDIRNQAN